MLSVIYQRVRAVIQGRSAKWPAVRKRFLQSHPECAACGRKKKLEVHHRKPREYYPEMELDAANLVTFCRDCHWLIGHGGRNWSDWIDDCDRLAEVVRKAVRERMTEKDVTW